MSKIFCMVEKVLDFSATKDTTTVVVISKTPSSMPDQHAAGRGLRRVGAPASPLLKHAARPR